METNWLIIVLLSVASISIVYFFIRQNQEDKIELMKKLLKDNEVPIQAEHENEVIQP